MEQGNTNMNHNVRPPYQSLSGILCLYIVWNVLTFCVVFLRQLEAIIRISESLAKMSLSPFATEVHVDEALRLFQVSTLEAAMSGSLSGMLLYTIEVYSYVALGGNKEGPFP